MKFSPLQRIVCICLFSAVLFKVVDYLLRHSKLLGAQEKNDFIIVGGGYYVYDDFTRSIGIFKEFLIWYFGLNRGLVLAWASESINHLQTPPLYLYHSSTNATTYAYNNAATISMALPTLSDECRHINIQGKRREYHAVNSLFTTKIIINDTKMSNNTLSHISDKITLDFAKRLQDLASLAENKKFNVWEMKESKINDLYRDWQKSNSSSFKTDMLSDDLVSKLFEYIKRTIQKKAKPLGLSRLKGTEIELDWWANVYQSKWYQPERRNPETVLSGKNKNLCYSHCHCNLVDTRCRTFIHTCCF